MNYTRRSNKPVTQFACNYLDDFLKDKLESCTERSENTLIDCRIGPKTSVFNVHLNGVEILNLVMMHDEPVSVRVSAGCRFDDLGMPVKVTMERLNGLLDELGCHGIIPIGVRVFKDKLEGISYLGKGDNKIAFGQHYASSVVIATDEDKFDIVWSDLFKPKKTIMALVGI